MMNTLRKMGRRWARKKQGLFDSQVSTRKRCSGVEVSAEMGDDSSSQNHIELVKKCVLLQVEKRNEAKNRDMIVMDALDQGDLVNLPALLVQHVALAAEGAHSLPYGFWLIKVFTHFEIPPSVGKKGGEKEMIGKTALAECFNNISKLGSTMGG